MTKQEPEQSPGVVTAAQVMRWLAEVELDGVAFYSGLGESSESTWIRRLAATLATAEERHRKRFLKYANWAEKTFGNKSGLVEEPFPPDLIRLLSSRVFVPGDGWKLGRGHPNDLQILQVAIRGEEQTAEILTRIRPYVPRPQRFFVSQVIKEEWNHVVTLERSMSRRFPKA